MPNLQDVFARIKQTSKEKRDIKRTYDDALRASKPYQDILDELKRLKDKKSSFESAIQADFQQELQKMESMKESLNTDRQLLTDMALTQMMKGETVEITDENDVKYEPVFKVSFKKAD